MSAAIVDHDLERAVIGAVLANGALLAEVPDLVPGNFGDPAHRGLWKAIRGVQAAGMAVDVRTVAARLSLPSEAEALEACTAAGNPVAPIADHARILVELHQRRQLLAGLQNTARIAQDRSAPWQDVREQAERMLVRTLQETTSAPPAEDLVSVFQRTLKSMREQAVSSTPPGLPLGLRALDDLTGGMRRREVTILAGKTGKGKSSLGWQAALAAGMAGYDVLGFSLEMEGEMLARRMMAAYVKQNAMHLHEHLRGEIGARLESFAVEVGERGWIGLHEQPALTVSEIRSRCRATKAEHPELALVLVDYLQLVRPPPGRYSNREREVAIVSEGLKELAKELNVAVLALSQFSRKVDEDHRRPRATDLRDSGAVENDSALVLALHDPDPKSTPRAEIPYEILVLKNRHGPAGHILDLLFHPAWTLFEEWTKPPPDDEEPKRSRSKAKAQQPSLLERSAGSDT